MLYLSRNQGSPSAAPATKSALQGSPSAVPATKSALRGSPSAVPATKSALAGPPASAAPATKSAPKPHVQKSRFTACACHEIEAPRRSPTCPKCCTCHENCISKQNSSGPLHLSRQVAFEHPNTRFPLHLAPATKSDHHVRKCAQHHNESPVARSTRRRQADFASLRSRSAHGRCRES